MKEQFKEALRDGEELLWEGGVEKFETLDVTHKKSFVIKTVITVIVVIALCIWLLAVGSETAPGICVVLALIAFWIISSTFSDARKAKKLYYGATNQRILIYLNETVKYTEYKNIEGVSVKSDADGHKSFLLGPEAQVLKPGEFRNIATLGVKAKSEMSPCERFVIYAVENPDGLEAVLKQFVSF